MKQLLDMAADELTGLLGQVPALAPELERLGVAMFKAWGNRGKVLIAGNGGSAADAMHLAEELSVRFQKNRKALAAVALCDPAAITCAGNDFGFETIFSRQVEALGNPGDVLIVLTTSGNSGNILKAIERARSQGMFIAAFLGRDGGKARGQCDVELIIPSNVTARVQEIHKLLYHALCAWVDQRTD